MPPLGPPPCSASESATRVLLSAPSRSRRCFPPPSPPRRRRRRSPAPLQTRLCKLRQARHRRAGTGRGRALALQLHKANHAVILAACRASCAVGSRRRDGRRRGEGRRRDRSNSRCCLGEKKLPRSRTIGPRPWTSKASDALYFSRVNASHAISNMLTSHYSREPYAPHFAA